MTTGTSHADPLDLTGQVALVTGAAQNIGFGIAQRLSVGGASIIALDKDADALEEAVSRLRVSGKAVGVVADVSSRPEVEAALETARACGLSALQRTLRGSSASVKRALGREVASARGQRPKVFGSPAKPR